MSRQATGPEQEAALAASSSEQDLAAESARTETLGSLASVLMPFLRGRGNGTLSDTIPGGHALPQDDWQAAAAIPASIGRYQVIGRLDGGGQADVFRAVHPALQKELVIKLARQVDPTCGFDPQRLVEEGKVLADLNHPHIARIFDLDFHEGQPFLVMEFIRGQNLARYASGRPLPSRDAAGLVAKIAHGLAAAHASGVVHRDLKPANILIDERGEPKIIDFGLADIRHAWSQPDERSGSVSGTAAYMPPEQARGETHRVDERSDVFALGAVLYFLLTRKAPFAGQSTLDSLSRAMECRYDVEALRSRHIDQGLARICLKALSAEPLGRYQTATDMAVALERLARRRIVVKRLAKTAAVVAPLALVGVLVTNAYFASPRWPTARERETQSPQAPGTPPFVALDAQAERSVPSRAELEITVGFADGGLSVPLVQTVPVRTDNDIQIRCSVPAGHRPALFWYDTVGHLTALDMDPLPDEEPDVDRFIFPRPGEANVVGGPSGTEVCFVVSTKDRQPTLEDIESLMTPGAWPELPSDAIVRFDVQGVEVHRTPQNRSVSGQSRSRSDDVRQRAELLRQALAEKFDAFAGVAFPNAGAEAPD